MADAVSCVVVGFVMLGFVLADMIKGKYYERRTF